MYACEIWGFHIGEFDGGVLRFGALLFRTRRQNSKLKTPIFLSIMHSHTLLS